MMWQANSETLRLPLKIMARSQFTLRFARIAVFSLIVLAFAAVSVFAQSGGIKGKVRNSRGSGISNASVTVRQDGKDLKTVRSDSKGNFEMQGLSSGKYNVVINADGYSSGALFNVEVKNNTRDLGDRLILSVDQGTQVIVKGSVFFTEGTSVTGAKVEIEEVRADGSTKKLGSGYSTVSGEFTFRMPEGVSKLRVTAKYKGAAGTKDIEVGNAGIYRLAITLDISRTEK